MHSWVDTRAFQAIDQFQCDTGSLSFCLEVMVVNEMMLSEEDVGMKMVVVVVVEMV